MDRRSLLQWLVATGGLAALHRLSARDLAALGANAHVRVVDGTAGAQVLTAQERRLVEAVAECIIPRTDTPGATDARVAEFVDLMLREWYPAADAARFRAGLAALDAASRAQYGMPFGETSGAQQVRLTQAQDDEVTALRTARDPKANEHWFAMLKYLTVWGYCTSEVAMRDVFRSIPRPMRYDGAAPVGGEA